jgi:protein-L-isoaspartate(D-aspartate) O-methyltransferase
VFHDFVGSDPPTGPHDDDPFALARRRMVEEQLRARDITDARTLDVMGRIPRERFVPPEALESAYADCPLPIGLGQTISQPYVVALMTQLARPTPESRALDVGVGSGYQTAILAEMCQQVYGVEILDALAIAARERLLSLGYQNVVVRCGDGRHGWPEHAPFDVIVAGAAPEHVPQSLLDQLAPGGRLVIPVGVHSQELTLITKQPDGSLRRSAAGAVRFVPLTGAE